MVALYNHVLDYVVELLTSPAIVNLLWPVKEFAKAGECLSKLFHTSTHPRLDPQPRSHSLVPFIPSLFLIPNP